MNCELIRLTLRSIKGLYENRITFVEDVPYRIRIHRETLDELYCNLLQITDLSVAQKEEINRLRSQIDLLIIDHFQRPRFDWTSQMTSPPL